MGRGCVGYAADAVGPRAKWATQPSLLSDAGGWVVEATDGVELRPCPAIYPVDGLGRRLDPGDQVFEFGGGERRDVEEVEGVDISVTQKAAEEALAGRVTTHEAVTGGVVSVGSKEDRGVVHGSQDLEQQRTKLNLAMSQT